MKIIFLIIVLATHLKSTQLSPSVPLSTENPLNVETELEHDSENEQLPGDPNNFLNTSNVNVSGHAPDDVDGDEERVIYLQCNEQLQTDIANEMEQYDKISGKTWIIFSILLVLCLFILATLVIVIFFTVSEKLKLDKMFVKKDSVEEKSVV